MTVVKRIAVSAAVVVLAAAAAWILPQLVIGGRFDSSVWMADAADACTEVADGDRAAMVGDLMEHHLRAGMTKKEVLALVGRPHQHDDRAWSYGMGVDCEFLHLHFDGNGRLARWGRTG